MANAPRPARVQENGWAAMALRSIGPVTVEVAPGKPASDRPSVSGVYRNKAAAEALPETYNGCATLYEIFNKAVEEHGDNRCGAWLLELAPRGAGAAAASSSWVWTLC